MEFSGVKAACCEFLEKQLDPSNCLGIRMFAESHNCAMLCQMAELYSHKYFEDVTNQEEFRSLKIDDVEQLIKSDELRVRFPYNVLFVQ